jgi:hypothetical protein
MKLWQYYEFYFDYKLMGVDIRLHTRYPDRSGLGRKI